MPLTTEPPCAWAQSVLHLWACMETQGGDMSHFIDEETEVRGGEGAGPAETGTQGCLWAGPWTRLG